MRIQKGHPVEFTREYVSNYVVGEGEFGIAVENERTDNTVCVELADGTHYLAKHIHAYGWAGWIPEELEDAHSRLSPYENDSDPY